MERAYRTGRWGGTGFGLLELVHIDRLCSTHGGLAREERRVMMVRQKGRKRHDE
jgi:hypothetical protein